VIAAVYGFSYYSVIVSHSKLLSQAVRENVSSLENIFVQSCLNDRALNIALPCSD
jgi:hypothetical protein